MAQTTVSIRMDQGVKGDFENLCNALGLTMSGAVNIFAKAMLREQGLPFRVGLETPNKETRQAMKEAQEGKNLEGPFHSVKELMDSLNADD